MKRVIFTTYDDINRGEKVNKSQATVDLDWKATRQADIAKQKCIEEYFDRLLQNKKDYAEKIGVEFIFYRNTMKDFEVDVELEFAKVNLYKHHLMANLAEEYDEVMYVDMDVVFNTDENVFEELDLSKGIYIRDQDYDIIGKDKQDLLFDVIGLRSPTLKYHITKDLLGGKDNHVMNTGIMLARSEYIKQIQFVDRLPSIINKLEDIKDKALSTDAIFGTIMLSYYPNNESIFSYILEEYNIPYVLMDEEWHKIYSELPAEGYEGKILHIINKQFGRFFKDKTKLIFSLHIDIPEERLDNPKGYSDNPENKSAIAKRQLNKYREKILDNHKDYAKHIGADYVHIGRNEEYEQFYKRFPQLSEYDVINLYKIWLTEKLTKDYDLVMYVDFDCLFLSYADAFDHVPCSHALCCFYNTAAELKIDGKSSEYLVNYNKDFRNPQAKYWNSHALLTNDDIENENYAYNTGVIIANKKSMEQLDFFGDIDEVLDTMLELKEDEFSMYPSNIRASFGYDNETIFSYKTIKNNVPVFRLAAHWHSQHNYDNIKSFEIGHQAWYAARNKYNARNIEDKAVIKHFISKNFSLYFEE
jgi:hypothetical protein